jgi:hypothetical protein
MTISLRSDAGRNLATLIRLALVLILSFLVSWASASDVCRAHHFQGMLASKQRADAVLPPNTTDIHKAVVYVEYVDNVLYYQSNFVTSGFEYPTKVKGDPAQNAVFSDATQVFKNIAFSAPPDPEAWNDVLTAVHNNVEFLIDVSAFDKNGIPRVDLSNIKNIKLVDRQHGKSVAVSVELLPTADPPPALTAKLRGCCLYGIPPFTVEGLSEKLASKPFDRQNVHFASLFIDRATEQQVDQSSLVKSVRVKGDANNLNSKADLEAVFEKAKGTTLVLIGHVEGADYVIKDAGNKEHLRVSIDEVRAMAKKNGILLIDIGCETTKAIKDRSFGFGVISRYNSVDAVASVQRAMSNAKTYRDFLENVSSPGLKIVVDHSFMVEPMAHASVYSQMKTTARQAWIKIAQITVTFIN